MPETVNSARFYSDAPLEVVDATCGYYGKKTATEQVGGAIFQAAE